MRGTRDGGRGTDTHSLENHKAIGFISNTGLDPLTNNKATKPAFNVWSSSVRQQNAIPMAFCWQADDGPLLVVFRSSLPSSNKKQKQTSELDPI